MIKAVDAIALASPQYTVRGREREAPVALPHSFRPQRFATRLRLMSAGKT